MRDNRPILREVIRALSGPLDKRARAALRPFASWPPHLRPATARALGRFAREHLDELGAKLTSAHHSLRHAAAYALGLSEEERAATPLVGLLCHQQDHFDHDFAYQALGKLGVHALRPLERFALEGSDDEAYEAVQALGQSSADPLPCLQRVLAGRSPLPERFFMAYVNMGDPRGLPDVLPALQSTDPRRYRDALYAASTLLEEARARGLPRPGDADAFADAVARFLDSDDLQASALSCLRSLRDPRYLAALEDISTGADPDAAGDAIKAIGAYRTELARAHLARLLDHPALERATAAAVALLEDAEATRATKERATAVAVQGLATLPGDSAWCAAATLCRTSVRLRRAVSGALLSSKGSEKKRLVYALVWMIPARYERRLLAGCSAEVRPLVARALEREKAPRRR